MVEGEADEFDAVADIAGILPGTLRNSPLAGS